MSFPLQAAALLASIVGANGPLMPPVPIAAPTPASTRAPFATPSPTATPFAPERGRHGGNRMKPRQGVRRASDISALLESDQRIYHIGDTVRLRVSLISKARQSILFDAGHTFQLVRLIVTGPEGNVMRQNAGIYVEGSGSSHWTTIAAAGTFAVARGAYTPLTYYGYRLMQPGRYTIVAIPSIAGDNVIPSAPVRSNKLRFAIAP